jgi:nucleoside-diphosphate-sugar epimerase
MTILSNGKNRVLVAGGAGFIGSNLIRHLMRRGCLVDCVDNLITGERVNLAQYGEGGRLEFHLGDICDPGVMERFEGRPYAEIYNLACPTGVPNIARLGKEMLMASSVGTQNLLRLARAAKSKYLFASSAEAYGDPKVTPQPESYAGNVDPVGPRSAYEEGKRFGEAMTAFYARSHGVDARIVRIFNTYGPNMSLSETRVIPKMLTSMISRVPVVVYGDGSNTRSFLYVDDLIAGFEAVMARPYQGAVFNIGGAQEISVLELFKACSLAAAYAQKPVFKPHFIEDHKRRRPDLAKVRRLGWRPRVTLRQGLTIVHDELKIRMSQITKAAEPWPLRERRARARPQHGLTA